MMITNKAPGPRGFNVGKNDGSDNKGDKGKSLEQVILLPGESRDIDLHDADHAVIKAMKESGEIEIGGSGKSDDPKAAPKFNIEGLNEQELRAFIRDRVGKDADSKADKASLMTQARALAASPVGTAVSA